MQIISDFHDYYDIGMKTGVDMQLPYRLQPHASDD